MIYCDYESFPEQLTLYTLKTLLGRVFGSGWKGFDFVGQIFTPGLEPGVHRNSRAIMAQNPHSKMTNL